MAENGARQRIAAILAADAVGYSRLMADDETATIAALDAARAIFREHIGAHAGRVVDTAGDSVLAVFETTYDFVDKHLADWEHGEWHSTVAADGSGASGDKGHNWKCGYHNGRAMIECIGVLRALKAKQTIRSRRRSTE